MKITFISDTHSKHKRVTNDLTGGDVLIHSGDISSRGYEHDVHNFLKWFDSLPYERKIFIAGNHDYYFERFPNQIHELIEEKGYEGITYLEDSSTVIKKNEWDENGFKVYGSPWQPKFYNWAFNLKRDSDEIEEKWNMIPDDTDILITHGPPNGILDWVAHDFVHAGCERLIKRVYDLKPKVHVFGHIHQMYGYHSDNGTMFLNASVLNGRYDYKNKPIHIELNDDGKVKFL